MITPLLWSVVGPSPPPEFNPDTVTPGVIGFVVTFLVAASTVLLMLDMTKRIRRTRYSAEIAERLDAEEAAQGEIEREEADRIIRYLDPDRESPGSSGRSAT